jgi:hypothetical protein
LPHKVFTMLVVMAVVTTVMTGPLLNYLLAKLRGLEAGQAAGRPKMLAG